MTSATLSARDSSTYPFDQTTIGRILVAEDDNALRELLMELLVEAGHDVIAVPTGTEALACLQSPQEFDVILTDLMMPGASGETVLAHVRESSPQTPVIVMTAFGTIDSAVRLVRAGAFDYVTKPVATAELLHALARAVRDARARRGPEEMLESVAAEPRVVGGAIVAESQGMRNLMALAARVASSPHPVLLTGESGTGKEVLAKEIHAMSGRGAFVVVNCGAIPAHFNEGELFEAAHGGTLFLDEVSELPASLQPALLRFVESGEVQRTGASAPRRYDVRVIAATHRDLESEMREGRFRADLYWRLNVLPLDVSPLRERTADVLPLARHFLTQAGSTRQIAPSTAALLTSYAWPGNVRELRNAMQRAATFGGGDHILPEDLPPRLREADRAAALVAQASQQQLSLRAVERAYVLEIVRRTDGNKSRAADILGLDRKTLYRKLAEYAQEPETEHGQDGEGERGSEARG